MNIATTIIGLALLGLFILPVIFISKSGRGKEKRLLKEVLAEASKNELIITESDSWNESALGIDEKNDKIIYIDESGTEKINTIFSLKDVKSFKTIPDFKTKKRQNSNYKNEKKLSLSFIFMDPAKSDINITFYIAGFGKMTDAEQLLFEKWSAVILKNIES